MNTLFKILGFLFTVSFLFSAVLQYNDPDPIIWMFIWGSSAIVSILFLLNKVSFTATMFLGVLSLVGFIYLYPSSFQGFHLEDGDVESVEKGREAFGLLIIALVMLMYSFRIRHNKIKKKHQS